MSEYLHLYAIAEESLRNSPNSSLYFLLDHSGLPGLCQKLSNRSAAWVSIFSGTTEAGALEVAPILILIGSNGRMHLSRNMFEWIGQEGTYNSTVIMLLSPLAINPMMRRLRARLDVKLSENMDAMLRFYDPRVLESLPNILSTDQSISFFGAAEAWEYIDRTGRLRKIESSFNEIDKFLAPLVLDQTQEFDLIDASEVDQVLDLVRTNVPAIMLNIPPREQYEFVRQRVEAAKKCGLDSVLKYVLYIVVPMLEEARFNVAENWARFIANLNSNDFEFNNVSWW
jgi:hypothetical protein